ncbi:hypothetical protein Q5P01_005455 [Channa striata]|uniref:Uncharacterized protein n=1 Tax=Channa striata TaxID=64152 RepID=A0AA88T1B5_CHASR|nr:hypothetical protein Q5P01_005455 [Channa striata]
MAQSDSCPNPDLSGSIVHSPVGISSNLDTKRGRGDEEREEEDEEVELAEEVGEDVLVMAEAGDKQCEKESREQGEMEIVRVIQVPLLSNGVIREGEGEGESLDKNRHVGVEVADKEQEKIDEHTKENKSEDKREEESKDTKTGIDGENEDSEQELQIASLVTEIREESLTEEDHDVSEHQIVSTTDDAETVKESNVAEEPEKTTQSSIEDTNKIESVIFSADKELQETIEIPTTDVASDIGEQIDIQQVPCQTTSVSNGGTPFNVTGTIEVAANQTNMLSIENQDGIKSTNDKNMEPIKQESLSINNNITWQEKDSQVVKSAHEGTRDFIKDVMSPSDDVLDTGDEANLEVKPSKAQSQTKRGIQVTRSGGINQKAQEEEQVRQVGANALIAMDGIAKTTEEGSKQGDNIVSVLVVKEACRGKGDKKMQQGSTVHLEDQAEVLPPEPVEQGVAEVPLNAKQNVDLDQVEEAFELEEGGEVELDQTEDEATSGENESTAEGGDMQEHLSQVIKETEIDWRDNLRGNSRHQVIIEDETGGEALQDTMMAEVEIAEEPVTVLDDEIEEIEEIHTSEIKNQTPTNISTPSPQHANVKPNTKECQKLIVTETELDKEKEKKQKQKNEEVKKYKKPKHDTREDELDINGKVKELKQAMENGILCPEPQPLRKEGWGTGRVCSPRKKDNDWIKNDQPETKREPEMTDWRKELKPVKKEIWENERGRKEWSKKDSTPEEKSLPRKEEWIKELKSVIKDESQPKMRDEQVKKKRVVLLEDGHSYVPQREQMPEEKREEVKLISLKRVESPLTYMRKNSQIPQDQDYEISLYVKVMSYSNTYRLVTCPP